jgi:uncharacterized protein Yka (UPF0111/DUF47 family)
MAQPVNVAVAFAAWGKTDFPEIAREMRELCEHSFDTTEELSKAYKELYEGQVVPLIEKGLSGVVYTQLSDIEEEVNGLVTYDRKVIKIQ